MATRTAHLQRWIHAHTQRQATDAIIALGGHLRDERLEYRPGCDGPEPQAPDWESIDPLDWPDYDAAMDAGLLADEEAYHGR